MKIETFQTITMPAGRYWIGDLCYVLRDEWDEVCSLFFKGRTDHGANEGGFTLADGRNFVCFNTAWGDGEYYDDYGNSYGVDAGCIGLIAVEPGFDCDGGNVHTFNHAFECRKEGRGRLIFGNVVIDTDA
jgi:hypothetical protein